MYKRDLFALCKVIAEELSRQNNGETDDSMDVESIEFTGSGARVNMVELADTILAHLEIEVEWFNLPGEQK